MITVETAASLRDWSFENTVEKHGEADISEPLAELAAAIDGELHDRVESIELGASAPTFPRMDQESASIEQVIFHGLPLSPRRLPRGSVLGRRRRYLYTQLVCRSA